MAGRDEPRQVATTQHQEQSATGERRNRRQTATSRGPVAAENEFVSRYVRSPRRENEFLRGQIAVKDERSRNRPDALGRPTS